LSRPFAYLFSFVYANATSRAPADGTGEPPAAFAHLHAMTAAAFDGFVHRVLFEASREPSPLRRLTRAAQEIQAATPPTAHVTDTDRVRPTPPMRGDQSVARTASLSGRDIGLSYSLPVLERWRLRRRLAGRGVKFLRFPRANQPANYDAARRVRLLERLEPTLFDPKEPSRGGRLLAAALAFVPTYFLEDFPFHLATAEEQLEGVGVMFSGPEFHAKAGVAVATALLKSRGGLVIGSQHGGSYGQTDPTWLERAEYAQADLYGTWGYRKCAKDRPLPSAHLSRRRPLRRVRQALARARSDPKEVLVVLPFISRGLYYSILSPPVSRQDAALHGSLSIVAALRQAGFRLTLRPHPRNRAEDYHDLATRALGSDWAVEVGSRGTLPVDAARFAAVVFLTPDATGLAELAAADMPFFVAARPEDFHFQPHARACYEALLASGVWISEPAADAALAAAALAWNPDKQVAWGGFAALFALHDRRFLDRWAAFLSAA